MYIHARVQKSIKPQNKLQSQRLKMLNKLWIHFMSHHNFWFAVKLVCFVPPTILIICLFLSKALSTEPKLS